MSDDKDSHFNGLPSQLDEAEFVECFGAVYEHSPWITRETWQRGLTSAHNDPTAEFERAC